MVRRPRASKEIKVPVVYEESSEIKHVAERLIRLYPVQFGWVANFKIGFVIVRGLKLNLDKREPWGKFKKVPPLYRGLTGLDAVVELVEDGWHRLAAEQQEALVAHELCHGSMSERGALRVEKHDLEEFRFVVAQWGAWDEGIRKFGEQLDLFTSRGPIIRTPSAEQTTLTPAGGDGQDATVPPTNHRRTNGGQQPPAPLS
jgi:Putative phage metallopeptidase